MKKYIWINPVTKSVFEDSSVNLFNEMKSLGYELIDLKENIANKVKSRYLSYCSSQDKVVLDTRCPLAIEWIKNNIKDLEYKFAPINPIFINYALELHNKFTKNNDNSILYMIAPCYSLCKYGEKIFSNSIKFLTWKDFCQLENLSLSLKKPDKTPIPLGFFDDLNLKLRKVSGVEKIKKTLTEKITKEDYDLIEMLYCLDGCHNGDGL